MTTSTAATLLAVFAAFCPTIAYGGAGQTAAGASHPAAGQIRAQDSSNSYELGPDDEITIRALEIAEISDKPVQIDVSGYIRLPMLGRIKAAGMTPAQLEAAIAERLKAYVLDPEVSVSVTQFRSQPVSVLGAVRNPGVYQLQGRRTLIEVLSLAGGLDQDKAGSSVKITRRLDAGRLPLEGAYDDPNGGFSIAEVSLKAILNADDPAANITLKPHDILTVPRAQLVYVAGQVVRAGGFVLNERKTMTVLEALTLAGGTDRAASPRNSRILRRDADGGERTEIAVNVEKILSGGAPDVPLQPEDILFIPNSAPKRAALRAVEAAVQMGTGVVIWRR